MNQMNADSVVCINSEGYEASWNCGKSIALHRTKTLNGSV